MSLISDGRLPRVGVLALGASNSSSIVHAIRRAGGDPRLLDRSDQFSMIDSLVIPGVANVCFLLKAIERNSLRDSILAVIRDEVPVLGICAGFQALFEGSDEAPGFAGLAVLNGAVKRLLGPKSPHMGWNRVEMRSPCIDSGWAYFAHSFAAPAESPHAVAITEYGARFASIARRGNVLGVQFHPERSGRYGAQLLESFVAMRGPADAG